MKSPEPDINKLGMTFVNSRSDKDFTSLYEPLKLYLIRFIHKRFPSSFLHEKEEAVDRTLIAVWEKIDLYDPSKSAFKSWATAIMRNNYLLEISHNKKPFIPISFSILGDKFKSFVGDKMDESLLNKIEDELDMSRKTYDLEQKIKMLPEDTAQMVYLKYIKHKTYKEIQEVYPDFPINTLKTRVRAGRTKLKAIYDSEYDSE